MNRPVAALGRCSSLSPDMLELSNRQREYLGLELIESDWERFELKAGPYQPESILYFDGDLLKKQIVSNENRYYEWPVNIQTRSKSVIIPKTSKGKEKKLTAATLEKYKPDGVSFEWTINGKIFITNHNTQINYYSNFQLEIVRLEGQELLATRCNSPAFKKSLDGAILCGLIMSLSLRWM